MSAAIFSSIFFGTFVLEDVALASAIVFAASGKIGWLAAFGAAFLGITVGDLAIYALGRGAKVLGQRRWLPEVPRAWIVEKEQQRKLLDRAILASRFIPGTRFVTYFAAGYLAYPAQRFFVLTLGSVALWVGIAFAFGITAQVFLREHALLLAVLLLCFFLWGRGLVRTLSDYWQRRALKHAWRKWGHFEFWPAWFFYLPIIPWYAYLGWKHRSLLLPFYASPQLKNGGLIGESKWDILQWLDQDHPATLAALRFPPGLSVEDAQNLIAQGGIHLPFVLKPDIGQRGYGVRIIRSADDLKNYLAAASGDLIAQSLSPFPQEAGIFYVREPGASLGKIFSITDKLFPFITGDGHQRLGDLILADPRARIIAPVYFERHREKLDQVLGAGEKFVLAECGNHCQGAIFQNGAALLTPALEAVINKIASQLPDFHFGRFDIRYQDRGSLMAGKDFHIVEINGAGSEATHIWDQTTPLLAAYKTLYRQWALLFAIGAYQRQRQAKLNFSLGSFLITCLRVYFRRDSLSRSS